MWDQQLTKAKISKCFVWVLPSPVAAATATSPAYPHTPCGNVQLSGSTALRWLVHHEWYIYHILGTFALQETSPGSVSCDSDSLGKESKSLTEPLWVTTPASSLRKGCYGDHGQTCNNYGSLATDSKGCCCKLSYSSLATCVKFVLPFIADLVHFIFSFSAWIKQMQWDGKLSHPKSPDQCPPIKSQWNCPWVVCITYVRLCVHSTWAKI